MAKDKTLPADAGIGSNDPDALVRAERPVPRIPGPKPASDATPANPTPDELRRIAEADALADQLKVEEALKFAAARGDQIVRADARPTVTSEYGTNGDPELLKTI